MKIHGLQKMTLLDYPGRVACTVFFGGCEMRCPFCHNAELLDGSAPAVMTNEELIAFLEKRKGLLDGVAFTGGEPLLQKDLPDLARRIRDLGYDVKLDTNGMHPDRLEKMLQEGTVQYVAMDIKNDPERYAMTAGLAELDLTPIKESISLSSSSSGLEESKTARIRSAFSASDIALSTPIFSIISSARRIPAVSAMRRVSPPSLTVSSRESRVVPAISVTIARSSPVR